MNERNKYFIVFLCKPYAFDQSESPCSVVSHAPLALYLVMRRRSRKDGEPARRGMDGERERGRGLDLR